MTSFNKKKTKEKQHKKKIKYMNEVESADIPCRFNLLLFSMTYKFVKCFRIVWIGFSILLLLLLFCHCSLKSNILNTCCAFFLIFPETKIRCSKLFLEIFFYYFKSIYPICTWEQSKSLSSFFFWFVLFILFAEENEPLMTVYETIIVMQWLTIRVASKLGYFPKRIFPFIEK